MVWRMLRAEFIKQHGQPCECTEARAVLDTMPSQCTICYKFVYNGPIIADTKDTGVQDHG